jgi:signal transduction histidine kinase
MLILVFYMVFNYRQLSERRIGLENMLTDERRKNQISFIRGQENERSGIAMFIHDHIISEIALIQHSILNAPSSDAVENKESAAKLSSLNNELRLLSHELMPESIEKLGLQIALSELLTNYSHDFRVNYFFDNSLNPMKSEVEIAVYRISQELMRNAKNHSRASCVSIQCVKDEVNLIYTYEDNGIGIDFSKIQKGLGFRGIEFRSDLLMGSVGYESRMGEGLVVTITIPL